MILNKVLVEWFLSSENWLWEWTKIQLWLRDLWTWEIKIIWETNTYIIDWQSQNWNNKNSLFSIEWNNVQIYEWWKQLIIIYNSKYIEVPIFEKNVIWLTWYVDNFYVYDMKTSWNTNNIQEANYIANTKTTPFDDPLINWYILWSDYWDHENNPNEWNPLLLSWKENDELMAYFNKLKWNLDESHWVMNLRWLEVESLVKKWNDVKSITKMLFEKTDIKKLLIENWFNENEIKKIQETWMLWNMWIYQEKFKADWVKREEINMKKIREWNYEWTDVEILLKDEIKNQNKNDWNNNIVKETETLNQNIQDKKENNNVEIQEVAKKDESIFNENNYWLFLNIILWILILSLIILKFIKKKREKNKENDNWINIINKDSDIN